MKILGIDNDGEINLWFNKVFGSENYELTSITNGMDGIRLIRQINYDLVFLDIADPDFKGKDVIDALKNEHLIEKQPIILFTSASMTDAQIDKLLIQGIHQCLRKPIDVDIISSVINGLEKKQEQKRILKKFPLKSEK